MEFFDDDDNDEEIDPSVVRKQDLVNMSFVELMKFKPFLKKANPLGDMLFHRYIAIVCMTATDPIVASLANRLKSSKFANVNIFEAEQLLSGNIHKKFDVFIIVDVLLNEDSLRSLTQLVSLSGFILFDKENISCHDIIRSEGWKAKDLDGCGLVRMDRSPVKCNTTAAPYWTHKESYSIEDEMRRIDSVTLKISESERYLGVFADETHKKAVEILKEYGVCIFPGIFDKHTVKYWGECARDDMAEALAKLRERGIDLFKPGTGPRIENFFELSMREAFRCDLRNGRKMNHALSITTTTETALPVRSTDTEELNNPASLKSLRNHQGLESMMLDLMNPPGGADARGNWGRWNFEGSGPDSGPPPLKLCQIGCIMSLPGCVDQTIHADIPHLYVHTQLPGHYFHMFMPYLEGESAKLSVGQSLHVLGSHILRTSAHIMVEEGGQEELEARIIRPHVTTGDALIFDCRLLHFGLANLENETPIGPEDREHWRSMIYASYHQSWFRDPKNWNNREKLFEENEHRFFEEQ